MTRTPSAPEGLLTSSREIPSPGRGRARGKGPAFAVVAPPKTAGNTPLGDKTRHSRPRSPASLEHVSLSPPRWAPIVRPSPFVLPLSSFVLRIGRRTSLARVSLSPGGALLRRFFRFFAFRPAEEDKTGHGIGRRVSLSPGGGLRLRLSPFRPSHGRQKRTKPDMGTRTKCGSLPGGLAFPLTSFVLRIGDTNIKSFLASLERAARAV